MSYAVLIALGLLLAGTSGQGKVETFKNVVYRGGHSAVKGNRTGVLALTDSTVEFREYECYRCTKLKPTPLVVIPFYRLTETVANFDRKAPSAGERIMLGVFAGETRDDLLTLSYDLDDTAEGPVFRIPDGQASAVLAKIKYRMRQLNRPPARAADDTMSSKGA